MSVLATPTRGFRMMCVAVALLMFRFLLEIWVTLEILMADTDGDLVSAVTWLARIQLVVMAAVALLVIGVLSNLPELRRRRWSTTTSVIALGGFAVTFAVHAWLYGLLDDVASGNFFDRIDDAQKIPMRMFLATVTLVVGLFSTVWMVRAYAMTDSNLPLREQARNIGGMLILLLFVDTFYRFSYGLGGGSGFGILGFIAAVGLIAFWLWCYRQLGSLFLSVIYYLRVAQDMPVAEVVRQGPPPTSKPGIVPPPVAVAPIEPSASVAPTSEAPTPIDGGPRFLA